MSSTNDKMEKFLDELGPIVDGDRNALARHADFLAADDRARDLRHDAEAAADALAHGGDDWTMPADLEAKLLAAIDAKAGGASFAPERTTEPGFAGAKSADAGASESGSESESESESVAPTLASTEVISAPVVSLAEARAAKVEKTEKSGPTPPRPGVRNVVIAFSALAFVGVAAAAAIAFWPGSSDQQHVATGGPVDGAVTGTLAQVVRAAAGETGTGVEIMPPGGSYAALALGADIPAGSTIRTDERTRARVTLSDGSEIVLNHTTELLVDAARPRHFDVRTGEIVADVAHLDDGPQAVFTTPTGHVNVVGTEFVLSAADAVSSVRVTRGKVRVGSEGGGPETDVDVGEEGILRAGRAPQVAPTIDLARAVSWAALEEDNTAERSPDSTVPGIGSLRARRPGASQDAERPLFVASQHVRVRIAGNVARTEVEQVFQNDSGDQLEGTYRFPLPADARISRLALEVDGTMQEGAFVAQNRAAAIWRGVIRHATPVAHRDPHEEYVWVPGPWRDPALLEWQRGGNFELRIFPIPAHGSRRVVIAYTQVVQATPEGRRYVYPLAHSRDGSLRIGDLDLDVRVAGAPDAHAVGYSLDASDADGARVMHYAARDFLPAGDLVVDYTRPEDAGELSYWTYAGQAAAAPPDHARDHDTEVVDAQRALAADARGYVAFALHPRLPARTEGRPHDYVLVLDSSQSMVGERWQRASTIAAGIVNEMDRRDRFRVFACDLDCREYTGGPGGNGQDAQAGGFRTPSSAEVATLTDWLGHVEPAGASDLVATLRRVSHVRDHAADRDVHVVYVGDGLASMGHRGVGALRTAADGIAQSEHVVLTTVGIGEEADSSALAAIARAGGGHYVAFVPGEHASSTALSVLETTYGVSLHEPQLTLPVGLSEMAPAELPTIRAGEEVVIVARMDHPDVTGDVVLRGTVGGQPFEQTYPVHLTETTSAGNLFVPALWAAGTIDRLELENRGEDEARIIALSRAYSVMSHHTSLLVLESEAMYRAFGVDQTEQHESWTGEEDAEGDTAAGEAQVMDELQAQTAVASADRASLGLDGTGVGGGGSGEGTVGLGDLGTLGHGSGSGYGTGAGRSGARARRGGSAAAVDDLEPAEAEEARGSVARHHAAGPTVPPATAQAQASSRSAPAPDAHTSTTEATTAVAGGAVAPNMPAMPTPRMPAGQWMHRVWYRVGDVTAQGVPGPREIQAASQAEASLRMAPDSRDRHRDAVRALTRVGRLDRALEVANEWIARDRLDAEALAVRADVLGRMGRRDEAIRVLSGVLDLRPNDPALLGRLTDAFDRAGDTDRACDVRISSAEATLSDAAVVGAALRCERASGQRTLADALLASVPDERVRDRASDAADDLPSARTPHQDLSIDATWSAASDLDLTIVAPDGSRISWMGGRTTVVGSDAAAIGREHLGLRTAPVGSYVIEIARTDVAEGATPAQMGRPIVGELRIRMLDDTMTVPFRLDGERVEVARARVHRESRLEAVQ
jgi:ferric-dicitrate binding protein FerR (iron transport regulator)/tetratricopeptide (TPR) repeat protein